jgi:hypothetical protein
VYTGKLGSGVALISTNAQYVTLHLEILDEVHKSHPVNPLEHSWDPLKHAQIGPSELLLIVSYLFAIPVLVLWWGSKK